MATNPNILPSWALSGIKEQPTPSRQEKGWTESSAGIEARPTLGEMNYMFNQWVANFNFLSKYGVYEWESLKQYEIDSLIRYNHQLWIGINPVVGTPPSPNNPGEWVSVLTQQNNPSYFSIYLLVKGGGSSIDISSVSKNLSSNINIATDVYITLSGTSSGYKINCKFNKPVFIRDQQAEVYKLAGNTNIGTAGNTNQPLSAEWVNLGSIDTIGYQVVSPHTPSIIHGWHITTTLVDPTQFTNS